MNSVQKKRLTNLVTLFIVLAIPLTIIGLINSRDDRSQAAPTPTTEGEKLKNLTLQILRLSRNKQTPTSQIQDLVKQRKQQMSELVVENPEEVVKNTYSAEIKQSLPLEVQPDLETEVVVEGVLEVSHSDDFTRGISKSYFDLRTDKGERLSLHFVKSEPKIVSGFRVRVKGIRVAEKVILDDGQSGNFEIEKLETNVLPAASVKKIAVILFNFQNDTREPFSTTTVRNVLFNDSNSVHNYFKEVSFNLFSFTGHLNNDVDVFGWYTIASDNTPCESSTNDWRIPARSAASVDGFSLSNYTNVIYAFPQTSACGYAGKAVVSGQSSWINGSFSSGVVAHELGHNFGAGHASTYRCTENGVNVPISSSCTKSEYGDPFDVMGNNGRRNHMNNFHKGRVGWYNPSNTQTVTDGGTYSVFPVEKITTSVQALRIPKDKDTSGSPLNYYYVEYRQPFGFDNFITTDPVVNGVTIRIGPNYTKYENTFLLDNTPSSTSFLDASLALNQTFTDPAKGISVKTKTISTQNATVDITFAGQSCVRANPVVGISPTTAWTTPTGSLSYSVSVTNQDNSVCGSSVFNITMSNPAGLIQSPSPLNLTATPGSTVSGSITISPQTGTIAEGLYSFTERATNSSANTFFGSATANYNVAASKEGDINNDGSVNSGDLAIMISTWGSTTDLRADINKDGKISSADLARLISRWGS